MKKRLLGTTAAVVLAVLATPSHAVAPPTRMAWWQSGELMSAERHAASTDARAWRTPLGSTWKIFMHAYLHAQGLQEPAYRCHPAQRQEDEEYCCDAGESVGRDEALARSCGPYFEPQRLGVSSQQWSQFWSPLWPGQSAPAWLLSLPALKPATEVAVPELLQALANIPDVQRAAARQALFRLALRDEAVFSALGTGPRYKTWSWNIAGARAGGAAGWLTDGSPFWIGGPGTSRTALHTNASWMAAQWPAFTASDGAGAVQQSCVAVSFFNRYPLRSVTSVATGQAALSGPLQGRLRLVFANGLQLMVNATPALILRAGPKISANLPLEDYVARVVDREGSGEPAAAARALAVAARSYVLQNATPGEGCWQIADDSRTQRVSPNPPSRAARAAAAFTEGLVVSGTAVRYHQDQAAPGMMSWQAAVAAARAGSNYLAILHSAYPNAAWADAQAPQACEALPLAEQWLARREVRWRNLLRAQPGFEPVASALRVCQLSFGTPHSDQRQRVIRIREWASREGRVTLIHEYLHLAYRHHPSGRDEAFIERLAQRLAEL